MEDKKLLYGILAVCVVTLVVSGISVYEVNTVVKQLNTQGEQIAALQEAQAPMNILYVDLAEQVNTQREQIAALEQSRFRQNVIADVAEPEAEVEIKDVVETLEEGINLNDPPENRLHMPAEESKSAIDAVIVRDAVSTTQSVSIAS